MSTTIPSLNDPRGIGSAFNDWASAHKWVGVCTDNNLQVLSRPYPIDISDQASYSSSNTSIDTQLSWDADIALSWNTVTDQVYLLPVHVKSAFGYWEVEATYDKANGALNPFSVFLAVPGYGRTCIAREQYVMLYTAEELENDPSKRVVFKVKIKSATGANSTINGVFGFFYGVKDHQTELILTYKMTTPYTSKMVDKMSLFPTSITSRYDPDQVDTEDDYRRAMKSKHELLRSTDTQSGDVTVTYNDDDASDHDLLLHYLDHRVHDLGDDSAGLVIALHSEYIKKSTTTDIRSAGSSESKDFSLSLHFLGICELVGSIAPSKLTISAKLFVVIPVAGRVELTSLKGSLLDDVGVTATVNVFAARGTAKIFAKSNSSGKHDLYCTLDLDVVLVGEFKVPKESSGGIKIYSLPF